MSADLPEVSDAKKKKPECEGSLRFVVEGVSKLTSRGVCSPVYELGGFGWRARVRLDGLAIHVSFSQS